MEVNNAIYRILRSKLFERAIQSSRVQHNNAVMTTLLLQKLLETIDLLARNVQFPEFTEHGIPHIESLTRRISDWTLIDHDTQHPKYLLDQFSNDEVFLLAFAVLVHDMGMLSQREQDLPPEQRRYLAAQFADLPTWVRNTHGLRIEGLLRRILAQDSSTNITPDFSFFTITAEFDIGVALAKSHNYWPNDPRAEPFIYIDEHASDIGIESARLRVLAAVLAIADLLDEDQARCDTKILLEHKAGNTMNRSHWLRHTLVNNILRVDRGIIRIQVAPIARWNYRLTATIKALNEYIRLTESYYNPYLAEINAQIRVEFEYVSNEIDPIQNRVIKNVRYFECMPDIHIFRSFMREVRLALMKKESQKDVQHEKLDVDDEYVCELAQFVENLFPTMHDAIITLQACRQFEPARLDQAQDILREDALTAYHRGNIFSMIQLTREV